MFTKQSNRGDGIIADVLGSVLTSPRALTTRIRSIFWTSTLRYLFSHNCAFLYISYTIKVLNTMTLVAAILCRKVQMKASFSKFLMFVMLTMAFRLLVVCSLRKVDTRLPCQEVESWHHTSSLKSQIFLYSSKTHLNDWSLTCVVLKSSISNALSVVYGSVLNP